MSGYRIPEIAKTYTDYDMIAQHTDLPDFPDMRTRMLHAFLANGESAEQDRERYALIASLLQLGTDTHDMVSVSNEEKEVAAARERQMQVLAGDYFSSRFYQILSESGEIHLIRQLTDCICELNKLKMALYMKMKGLRLTAEEYLHAMVLLKQQLFLSFKNQMNEGCRRVWPEILELLTTCEVVFDELFRLESMRDFRESWGFWHVMQNGSKEDRKGLQNGEWDYAKLRAMVHKYRISSHLKQMLESTWTKLIGKAAELLPEGLRAELMQIGEPFRRFMAKSQALSEI